MEHDPSHAQSETHDDTDNADDPTARDAGSPVRAVASETERLAQFALLADPSRIAGTDPEVADSPIQWEVERLRTALSQRAREIDSLRQSLPPGPPESNTDPGSWTRSRATDPAPGWMRRPLVTDVDSEGRARRDASKPDSKALFQARAELRESNATLAIARETTLSQRRELAGLRARIDEAERAAEHDRQEYRTLQIENEAKDAQIRALERDLAEARARPEPFAGVAASTLSAEPSRPSFATPPIVSAWRDDQVRRHFGPMGIDCLIDLMALPLSRAPAAHFDSVDVVLIGRSLASLAVGFAEHAIQNDLGPVRVHVADFGAASPIRFGADHPLRDYVQAIETRGTPDALERTLDDLNPAIIVCHDLLSHTLDVDRWLASFDRLRERGCALVFAERTGVEPSSPPAELVDMGDRIWERMPDRYKCSADTGKKIETWHEAFASLAMPSPNGLREALRERFVFDLFAQFGYLIEPFIFSPAGENFSVDARRDRRFLQQLADLDDRKVESGTAPAHHLVALVDPKRPD